MFTNNSRRGALSGLQSIYTHQLIPNTTTPATTVPGNTVKTSILDHSPTIYNILSSAQRTLVTLLRVRHTLDKTQHNTIQLTDPVQLQQQSYRKKITVKRILSSFSPFVAPTRQISTTRHRNDLVHSQLYQGTSLIRKSNDSLTKNNNISVPAKRKIHTNNPSTKHSISTTTPSSTRLFPTHTAPLTSQKRFNMRDDLNKRIKRDEKSRSAKGGISSVDLGRLGQADADANLNKELQLLSNMFPDKKITPYDPKIVAIREQLKKDGVKINKDGQLVAADGTIIETDPTKVKKDSLLTKMDKKFGGSWFIGRLSPWQIVMVVSLICLFFYAGRKHKERTELLPQKIAAKPMIDFVRTTTLLKYVWTLRLMLEVGALVPVDGTEGLMNEIVQEEIEQELVELSVDTPNGPGTTSDVRREDRMAKKLKEHPEVKKNLNYIAAITILDKELHELDKELRQALLDLMELYVSLGRPYADSYSPEKQSVDAIFTHSQSSISLPDEVDSYLSKHERMKDALQVLFTRQNSAHRHYGQMFSDVYALTFLKAGVWNLPKDDRVLVPDEIQYYIQSIGYDIVRVWQDNYVHNLGKKLGKHITRLAFPSEIVDYGLQSDHRSQSIEPFIRELRRIEPKVIADYNDFLDYNLNISLTDNYKRWWRRMLQNMPRFRRSNDPPANITLSNYTQLFRDYERIFGKVPYLALVSREVEFLERLKDFSLGNQDLRNALDVIENMQTTSKLERVTAGSYSVEAVVDGAKEKIKEMMDRDFQEKLSSMSYLDEKKEMELLRDHERRVARRQSLMKRHQHTLSLLSVPSMIRTRYLYNLVDIGSPVLQIVKDHLGSLEQNGIFFPLYPCVGSFRDFYQTISTAAQVLCQRDAQLVELKKQLGQVYRALDSTSNPLSDEMKARFQSREQELLAVPDVREYALSMTRDEIARDDQFVYGKTAGLFELDSDKQKMNVFNEFEDDLTPNHPVNRGERGKIQYQIVIPDPPKHVSHAIWMLDSYVDVRPGRPDHGEDRRAFAARKFNSIRSFMPIPTRYVPQSSIDILNKGHTENLKMYNVNTKDGTQEETLAQKQYRKSKLENLRQTAQKALTADELHTLQQNKLERLHAIAGANLVKLESCIIQDLIELNSWGVEIRIPLDGLRPNQFKHYIQPPYTTLERETISSLEQTNSALGPISAQQHNALLSTRASLVVNGKYKLLDKYQQDLLKLQQQGFNIAPAVLLPQPNSSNTGGGGGSTSSISSQFTSLSGNINTTTATANLTPQHIPSATEIANSGMTPAEYYAKHSLEQMKVEQQPAQRGVQAAQQRTVNTMNLLSDETRLEDYSIPLGFPTMSIEGFNDIQAQLENEQKNAQDFVLQQQYQNLQNKNKNISLNAVQNQLQQPSSSQNIQRIALTGGVTNNNDDDNNGSDSDADVDSVFAPLSAPSQRQLAYQEKLAQKLTLPVPLTPTNIPVPRNTVTNNIPQQQLSYKDGAVNTQMPISPVYRGEKPLVHREEELQRQQARSVVEKLGQSNQYEKDAIIMANTNNNKAQSHSSSSDQPVRYKAPSSIHQSGIIVGNNDDNNDRK